MARWQYQQKAEPLQPDGPFLPAWQPQVVDQVPRAKTGLSAALLATAIATFVVAPSALEAAARATYPDQIHRPAVHASRQQALAFSPDPIAAPAVVPEQWTPSYPDRLSRAGFPTHLQQAWAGVISRTDLTAASAPSASGVITRPAQVQYQSITGPVLVPSAAPDHWAPDYPDLLLPARRSPLGGLVAPVAPLGGTDLRWLPTYPDRDRRREVHPSQQQALAFHPEPIQNPPAPELSWAAVYPDRVLPQVRLAPSQQQAFAFWPVPIPTTTSVTLHRLLLALTTEVAAPPPVFTDLRWEAVYPDRFPPRPFPVGARTFRVDPFPPALPVTALSWQGSYPSRIVRPVFLTARQQAFVFSPSPVAPPVVVALSWLSHYPDLLLPVRFLTARQQPWAANLDPITAPALVPLSWEATYPDQLLPGRAPRPWSGMAAPEPSETATTLGAFWRPDYPALLWRPLQGLAPTPVLVIPLGPLADAVTCLELIDLAATQPGVLTWTATQSTILLPDGTQPGVLIEVC